MEIPSNLVAGTPEISSHQKASTQEIINPTILVLVHNKDGVEVNRQVEISTQVQEDGGQEGIRQEGILVPAIHQNQVDVVGVQEKRAPENGHLKEVV